MNIVSLNGAKRMQATARRLSVVSATSCARRRLIRVVRRLHTSPVRTTLQILLFVVLSAAHAQDFKSASYLRFEYVPGRSGEGYTLKYSQPLDPAPFLAALSTADRVAGESHEADAVIVEADITIGHDYYRAFFPALPTHGSSYTFAIVPAKRRTDRTHFKIPTARYPAFVALYRQILDEHYFPSRPGSL